MRNKENTQLQKKDEIKVKKQAFREKNIDKIKEYERTYREKNKERLKEKKKECMICECGCRFTKRSIKRHQATKKHIDLMNKI